MRARPNTPLIDARQFVHEHRKRGVVCPCCDQIVKVYSWALLAKMAATLVWMTRVQRQGSKGWIHVNAPTTPAWIKEDRSYPKLVHWGLIESLQRAPGSSKRCSGYWRPTVTGRKFARGESRAARRVFVCNNRCVGRDPTTVTIRDALGTQFDYDKLLRGA
jgi:hypothetical protein